MDPLCLLGQALECSVCLEQLNSSSRVLPCQHTFCSSCLLDIVNTHKELRCPECRVLVTVPFDQLPPNILLLRILEGMKKIPQPPEGEAPNHNPVFNPLTFPTCSASPNSVSSLTNTGIVQQTVTSPNSLPRTLLSSQSSMHALESASTLFPQSLVNTQVGVWPQVTLEFSIQDSPEDNPTSNQSSLIQTMPAYTQTKPTTSLSRYLFTPPRNSVTFSSSHSLQARLSTNLGSLGASPRINNVQNLVPGSSSSSTLLLQTGDSYQLPTMINSILATNLQVVSSPVDMPPIPSVVSPLVSSSTAVSSTVQWAPCSSNPNSSISSSSVSLFESNSSCFSTNSSSSPAVQPFRSSLPFGFHSQGTTFDSSLRIPRMATPISTTDSSVLASTTSTPPLVSSSHPIATSEVGERDTLLQYPASSHPLGRRSQNFETLPSTVSPEESQSAFNSRAEEQFKICSSLIEKGSPMAFSSNVFAKAIFTYMKREPRDLSFNKGDVIQVRKKIDENWYQGELHGNLGFFPASYVKIIEQLPSNVPQCKALYDFKMTSQEEKDCLTFNKGDVITVLRRIDENWAEGKFQTRIGIFPLSFVDLNPAAKTLIRIANEPSDSAPTPHISNPRNNPEIPPGGPSATTPKESSSNPFHLSSLPPSPAIPTSGAVPSTAPCLATDAVPQDTLGLQRKRHSFTDASIRGATSSSPSLSISNRFSLDVANVNHVLPFSRSSSFSSSQSGQPLVSSNSESAVSLKSRQPPTEAKTPISKGSTNASILQYFIAIYSYRPRKADELELKKGQIYSVSEKCQDGWYKGRCITTDKIGVFPGNYVSFATLQTLTAHRAKLTGTLPASPNTNNSPSKTGCGRVGSPVTALINPTGPSCTRSPVILNQNSPTFSVSTCKNLKALPSTPPDLPPRHISSAPSGSSSPILPPSTSEGSCPSSVAANADKKSPKDKSHCNGSGGGGGMGLMRKLAGSKKKCKSPPLLSLDNPVFEESSSKSNTSQKPTIIVANSGTESLGDTSDFESLKKNKQPLPLARERYRCIVPYPANSGYELELQVGDIIYVHKKREDGWYKGTLQRTGQTGLFPASFVECC